MNVKTQRLSAWEAALALDANEIASFAMFRHLPNVTFHNEQGLVWFETGIHDNVFNRVLQARLAPDTASTALDKLAL